METNGVPHHFGESTRTGLACVQIRERACLIDDGVEVLSELRCDGEGARSLKDCDAVAGAVLDVARICHLPLTCATRESGGSDGAAEQMESKGAGGCRLLRRQADGGGGTEHKHASERCPPVGSRSSAPCTRIVFVPV